MSLEVRTVHRRCVYTRSLGSIGEGVLELCRHRFSFCHEIKTKTIAIVLFTSVRDQSASPQTMEIDVNALPSPGDGCTPALGVPHDSGGRAFGPFIGMM